jgi:cell division transport system permease protein
MSGKLHFKTAFSAIRRSPFQALSAFVVLTITFFVITLISVTAYSSQNILKYFETRPQIIAFLKDDISKDDVSKLESSLKGDSRISEVIFVSKEEALGIYKKATSDNPLLSELVSPSIFPASLEISLSDLTFAQPVIDEIKKNSIVEQIGFTAALGGDDSLTGVIDKLRKITFYVRVGGGAFAVVLAGTSFLVLIVIIGMRMTTRRGEIEILNLIGATPKFIRNPIIIEAVTYAISGVFTGWIFAFLLILYATPSLISYFGEIPILPRDPLMLFELFGIILAGELIAGSILAFAGSLLAVSRARKR